VLNSPHIPAWKAGRKAARIGTQQHAVTSGPSWQLENQRGSSQLPVTVSKGSLDTSLAGQTCKATFCKARADRTSKRDTQECHLCLQAAAVRSTLQGLPLQPKELWGFARENRDSCTPPSASRPRCPSAGIGAG